MDHMFIPLEEGVPDGCVTLEILYLEGNRVEKTCSCDIHWNIYKNEPLPDFYRISIEELEDG